MFALVRFVYEEGSRLHVVPVDDIEDFSPNDTTDFDNRLLYSVMWRDSVNEENTGTYSAQVLMLDYTRDGLEKRHSKKRVHIPKLYTEELDTNSDEDQQQQRRKERKRRKVHRTAAKSSAYDTILKEHLETTLMSSVGKAPSSAGGDKVGARLSTPSATSSEEDSLCARSELQKALKEKKMWKTKALHLQQQNNVLLLQVASLQRCLESKIFDLETRAACQQHVERTEAASEGRESLMGSAVLSDQALSEHAAAAEEPGRDHLRDGKMGELPAPPKHTAPAAVQPQGAVQDFTYTEDGLFHLRYGILVSGAQAAKILGNKKATLVCKDTAQAIWGSEVLAARSYSGAVGPKQRALGEEPKPPLTPVKVDVVRATMEYWGTTKCVDVTDAVRIVPRLLTEKIQDVKKAMRKIDAMNCSKE